MQHLTSWLSSVLYKERPREEADGRDPEHKAWGRGWEHRPLEHQSPWIFSCSKPRSPPTPGFLWGLHYRGRIGCVLQSPASDPASRGWDRKIHRLKHSERLSPCPPALLLAAFLNHLVNRTLDTGLAKGSGSSVPEPGLKYLVLSFLFIDV